MRTSALLLLLLPALACTTAPEERQRITSRGVFVAGTWRNVRPGTHLAAWGIAADTTEQRQPALVLHSIVFRDRSESPGTDTPRGGE